MGEKAFEVLSGRAAIVAAAIRRKATTLHLTDTQRKNADAAADYLLAKAPHLNHADTSNRDAVHQVRGRLYCLHIKQR